MYKSVLILAWIFTHCLGEKQLLLPVKSRKLILPAGAENFFSDIDTTFSCIGKKYGYYADVYNECKIYHVCHPTISQTGTPIALQYSFMCPEHTIFDQKSLICARPSIAVACAVAKDNYNANRIFENLSPDITQETKNKVNDTIDKDKNESSQDKIEVTTEFHFNFPEAEAQVHSPSDSSSINSNNSSDIYVEPNIDNSYFESFTSTSSEISIDPVIVQSSVGKEYTSGEMPEETFKESSVKITQNEELEIKTMATDFTSFTTNTPKFTEKLTTENPLLFTEKGISIENEKYKSSNGDFTETTKDISATWQPETTNYQTEISTTELYLYDRYLPMKMPHYLDISKENLSTFNRTETKKILIPAIKTTSKSINFPFIYNNPDNISVTQRYLDIPIKSETTEISFSNVAGKKETNNTLTINESSILNKSSYSSFEDNSNLTRLNETEIDSMEDIDYFQSSTDPKKTDKKQEFHKDENVNIPKEFKEKDTVFQRSKHDLITPEQIADSSFIREKILINTDDLKSYKNSKTEEQNENNKFIVCDLKQANEKSSNAELGPYFQKFDMQSVPLSNLFEFSYFLPLPYAIPIKSSLDDTIQSGTTQKIAIPIQFIYPSHILYPSTKDGSTISRIHDNKKPSSDI